MVFQYFRFEWAVPLLIQTCLLVSRVTISLQNDSETEDQGSLRPQEYYNDSSKYMRIDDMIINIQKEREYLAFRTWPEGVIPYSFHMALLPQQKQYAQDAVNWFNENTCLTFRPTKRSDKYNLLIQQDPMGSGCSSMLGWQNTRNQPLYLGRTCSYGNALHEIMHALGFFHEHVRTDRDDYVIINYENIKPGHEQNFVKISELLNETEIAIVGLPYDYTSIMHYGPKYFSRNGENTIDVKREVPGIDEMGQRNKLTPLDMLHISKKYGCPPKDEEEVDEPKEDTEPPPPPSSSNSLCDLYPQFPFCKSKIQA